MSSIDYNLHWSEKILWLLLVSLIIFFAAEIVVIAKEQARMQSVEPAVPQYSNQYPKIPQCDKELWKRITEGCP